MKTLSAYWQRLLKFFRFPVCGACNKHRIHTKKRIYTEVNGTKANAISQSKLCRKCYTAMKIVFCKKQND